MVIMFMISSCTALSSIVTTVFALSIVVDTEHRVRNDRIDTRPHAIYRGRDWVFAKVGEAVKSAWHTLFSKKGNKYGDRSENGESESLLG